VRRDDLGGGGEEGEEMSEKEYSEKPCDKCGAYKIRVELEDEANGDGTYYEISCDGCGHSYKVDGPDA
jgi:hypothetical protein